MGILQRHDDPDKQGYYGYHTNHRVYYEVMDYGKMLSDAKKRNSIFFDKPTSSATANS